MFLVIDCGNTNTVFALYSYKNKRLTLEKSWRLDSNEKRTPDDYFIWLNQVLLISKIDLKIISGVSVASVVPEVLLNIKLMLKTYFNLKTLIVGEDDVDLKIKVNIDNPNEAGSDRLVNACAVKFLNYAPAIVIDFGTATTFDIIGQNGSYEGGIIAPGINLSLDALYRSASRLPKITIRPLIDEEKSLIGKTTISAMESGAYWGYVCMIEGLIKKLKARFKDSKVIATGGLSKIFFDEINLIDFIYKDLTVYGLAQIYISHFKIK